MRRFILLMLSTILLLTCLPTFAEGNGAGVARSFPTAFSADGEGKILTGEAADAAPETGATGATGATDATDTTDVTFATPNEVGAYRVIVYDTDGNPVQGAVVQMCDDTTCSLQKTGEDGVATFQMEKQKVYEVHVAKVPEGYVSSDETYLTLDTFSDVNITVSRAE